MKWNRLLSILLCLLLMASLVSIPASAANVDDFKDVSQNAWYYDAVKNTVDRGIFEGTSATTFSPNAVVTRGMFVQLLANFTANYKDTPEARFTDISSDAWYGNAANWAYDYGLVTGVSAGVFAADQPITREQAATILFSYTMRVGGETRITTGSYQGFKDAAEVSDWAQAALRWAVQWKVMASGVGNNVLSPKGRLTRAQAAQLFLNLLPLTSETPYITPFGGIVQDPELSFLYALNLTYGELIQNTASPKPYQANDYYQSAYYFDFDDYPQARYLFSAGVDYPASDAKPIGLMTTVEQILPELVDRPFGEAVSMTKGNLKIYYETNGAPYLWFRGTYLTDSYEYYIILDDTSTIKADCSVLVTLRE